MVIRPGPELELALNEHARQRGISPEDLALAVLRERFLTSPSPIVPQDEWERRLLGIATDCGVSLPHEAVSSEGLYDA